MLKALIIFLCLNVMVYSKENENVSWYKQFKADADPIVRNLIDKKLKYKIHMDLNDKEEAHVLFDYKNKSFNVFVGFKSSFSEIDGEGVIALVCHEYGHVATGTLPEKDEPLSGGVGTEENADYWAAKVCMPKLLEKFPQMTSTKTTPLDKEFEKACLSTYDKKSEGICYRSLRGAYFFRSLSNSNICNSQNLSLETTIKNLNKTPYKDGRPPAVLQCSFNNFIAGTLRLDQPKCINLMMNYTNYFGEKCEKIQASEATLSSVVDTGRSTQKEIGPKENQESLTNTNIAK
jgi:hypothetical protein